MKKIIIFDAYGTLFDVNAAARNYSKKIADPDFIKIWSKVSNLWRDKQIGYTWYYNSIGYRTNFWKITEDALDYALEYYNLNKNDNLKNDLLELYKELDTFPEVLGVLKELKSAGYPSAILSNGTMEMLNNAAIKSNINNYLDIILSAEKLGAFKPNEKVYNLVLDHFGCDIEDFVFVSSNGWDAAGGAAFGFSSIWINRNKLPKEKIQWEPTWIGSDLNAVLKIL